MKFKELRESYKDKMATQSSENGISPETHVELTKESVEVVDEAFKRIPGNMINGELPRAVKGLESILKGLKAGDDFDDKAFNKILASLGDVKRSAKSFKSEDDVSTQYQYTKKESVEVVDEAAGKYSKSGDNLMYKWGDVNKALMNAGLNPRAILNVLTGLSKKEVK